MSTALSVKGLTARIGDLDILRGVDLEVPFGEVHALMGPNGSGKSTLCHALMGRSGYETGGTATVGGVSILDMETDGRSAAGLFEAFQYPVEIPGVSFRDLVAEMAASSSDPSGMLSRSERAAERLKMAPFLDRPVNVGLSGGEKKRAEMFQLAVAAPKIAILDEIDSGLDIDAVREVAELVETLRSPELGILIITHYSRILRYMSPDKIHVMVGGRIVRTGGPEVADELESSGYEAERSGGDPFADLP
ncbi:MAG: Fe-S cluster assembly ATPase SufC [Acidimicrobiia bacterium]|nr:Fe-S cluster assembly ATPase SufC [Acidimicrobiia bacterium]